MKSQLFLKILIFPSIHVPFNFEFIVPHDSDIKFLNITMVDLIFQFTENQNNNYLWIKKNRNECFLRNH